MGRPVRQVAKAAHISEGRWRQLENGYAPAGTDEHGNEVRIPANPKPDTAMAMARAVGVDESAALVLAGYDPAEHIRDDAAIEPGVSLTGVSDDELLGEVRRRMGAAPAQLRRPVGMTDEDFLRAGMAAHDVE